MDHAPILWAVRSSSLAVVLGVGLGLAGLLLLTWAWWDLRGAVRGTAGGVGRIRLATAAWAAPMMLAPPLFSGDGWSYVATGYLAGHGMSPYQWTPAALELPLRSGVALRWLFTPSPYGPLFLGWGGALSRVSVDPWTLLTSYRVLAVLGLALLAWAVPVLARRAGRDPVDATALALASPFVLAQGVGGLHNDLTMAALVAAALAVTRRGGWLPGAVLVGVAAAVKAPGLLAMIGVVLLSVAPDARWPARLRRTAEVGAVVAVTVLVAGWVTGLGTGWIGALTVPESEHTVLALPWVLGRWLHTVLVTAGPLGVSAVHLLHPALLARRAGLALLVLTTAWVLLVRRIGSPARAVSGTGVVLLAAMLLGPEAHYWYFLWCLPLLACAPLGRPAYAALVAAVVTLGLVAPADSALHQLWLLQWAAAAVMVVPVAVGLVVRFLGARRASVSA
jgi:alpha-1,6-mannosyltransferase